jgi:hypothetical protein
VADEAVEVGAVAALGSLLELGVDVARVILESACPTWLMTHLTSKLLARNAIEM